MNQTGSLFQKKNIPNMISCIRFLSFILFFLPPLSVPFLIVFFLLTATDALDGFLARKMGVDGPLGAKMDSLGDLFLFAVTLICILPFLWNNLPRIIWFFVGAAILIRIMLYVASFFRDRKLLATHAFLNKATSVMLFLLPFATLLSSLPFTIFSFLIALTADAAAVLETVRFFAKKKEN